MTAVPGPSAVLTALAVSGLPVDRFCFEGFLPRKAGERRRRLAALADEERTMVFFEAPHRTARGAGARWPRRSATTGAAAVCRELTKTHEEVRRGPLRRARRLGRRAGVRGEVTIVVSAAPPRRPVDADPDVAAGRRGRRSRPPGSTRKEAIVEVARRAGVPKRQVYDAVHRGT